MDREDRSRYRRDRDELLRIGVEHGRKGTPGAGNTAARRYGGVQRRDLPQLEEVLAVRNGRVLRIYPVRASEIKKSP